MTTPTVNGCDLTPSTRTETSEQEYSDLTASNRRPSTLPPAFLVVYRTCVIIFGILPRFLKNFLESESLVCRATARTKTRTGYHPAFVQILSGTIFSRHSAYIFLVKL